MLAHEEKDVEINAQDVKEGAVPAYLLDREQTNNSKVLTNMLKQKRYIVNKLCQKGEGWKMGCSHS